jgi:hypothetical protein
VIIPRPFRIEPGFGEHSLRSGTRVEYPEVAFASIVERFAQDGRTYFRSSIVDWT